MRTHQGGIKKAQNCVHTTWTAPKSEPTKSRHISLSLKAKEVVIHVNCPHSILLKTEFDVWFDREVPSFREVPLSDQRSTTIAYGGSSPWNSTGFYYSPRYPQAYRGRSPFTKFISTCFLTLFFTFQFQELHQQHPMPEGTWVNSTFSFRKST